MPKATTRPRKPATGDVQLCATDGCGHPIWMHRTANDKCAEAGCECKTPSPDRALPPRETVLPTPTAADHRAAVEAARNPSLTFPRDEELEPDDDDPEDDDGDE